MQDRPPLLQFQHRQLMSLCAYKQEITVTVLEYGELCIFNVAVDILH